MKYEMIFGDEKLFDGAPDDAEYAGWFCQEIRWYMILNGKILFSDGGTWCTSDNPYLSADIAAMRRIIRTPTWSVADQKAGKLPEVGCLVVNKTGKVSELVTIKNGYFVLFECGKRNGPLTIHGDLLMKQFKPIETPAEKAQRLEDEFVKSEMKDTTLSIEWACIYARGVRAAYRKLKGGE